MLPRPDDPTLLSIVAPFRIDPVPVTARTPHRGRYGRVYRIGDRAIKVPQYPHRPLVEAAAWCLLAPHPLLPPFVGIAEGPADDGTPSYHIHYQWVEGQPLHHVWPTLSAADQDHVWTQLAQVRSLPHALCHNDLHPNNVIVNELTPYIIDWGEASFVWDGRAFGTGGDDLAHLAERLKRRSIETQID